MAQGQSEITSLSLRFGAIERAHPILIAPGLLERCGVLIREAGLEGAVVLISDHTVAGHHGTRVRRSLEEAGFTVLELRIPPGEGAKTLDTAIHLYRQLAQAGVGRDGILVGLGGGVVLDLAGFVAATYMRGIAFVSIPTTLLAMVDAAIGGKTGVDLPEGKNLVGAFYPPHLLLLDPAVLRTLPPSEWRNGMAEVVKAALIGDAALWGELQECPSDWAMPPDPERLLPLVLRAIEVKKRIVERDPWETEGEREWLNLGHTFGHAFERLSGYRVPHGEAVAAGMAVAAALSARLGLLEETDLPRQLDEVLRGLGLPTRWRTWLARYGVAATPGEVIEAMRTDKKRRGGRLRFVLIRRPGWVGTFADVPEEAVHQALEETAGEAGT